jgi:hypothetical protein
MDERLLRDGWEARALAFGHPGTPSSPAVAASLEFIRHPSAQRWYRAHNTSVVGAYLEHQLLASRESRVERFFINLVLMRVLYAHALVAAPRLALGWLAFAGRPLGDPRLGMTGIFLSLSRVLPDRYPLGDDLTPYLRAEHGIAHLLDVGVIQPRLELLYDWSACDLAIPGLRQLLDGQTPCYAWPAHDQQPWHPPPSRPARLARTLVPATAPYLLMSAGRSSWITACNFPKGSPGSTGTSPIPFSGCGPVGSHRSRLSSMSDGAPARRTAPR